LNGLVLEDVDDDTFVRKVRRILKGENKQKKMSERFDDDVSLTKR
jgi:hypothetical protein